MSLQRKGDRHDHGPSWDSGNHSWLGACAAGGVPGPTLDGDKPTLPASATATPLADGLSKVADFGEPVWGAQSAGDTIWVEGGEGDIHQLDGATGEELQSLPGSWPVIQDGKLWYVRDDELIEANAASGKQLAAYEPPVLGTAVHDRILWAADSLPFGRRRDRGRFSEVEQFQE